jgi:predicted metal-dependent RNase
MEFEDILNGKIRFHRLQKLLKDIRQRGNLVIPAFAVGRTRNSILYQGDKEKTLVEDMKDLKFM